MGKVIDITEKLEFEEAPKLKIKNAEVSVNADAVTMLKAMQLLSGDPTPKDVSELYNLLIPEGDQKKLEKLKLNFSDFRTVVMAAISAVTGTDMDEVPEKEL